MLLKEKQVMNNKAVALLSGGLDSTVAVKMMLEQGIELTAVNFKSPFCCCNRKNGCGNEANRVSKEFGIPFKMISVGLDYIEMIRNPKFGYGKSMNPCLDCRIFMHRKAAEFMEEIGATFLITGEVLGQRPMSQRRDAMNLIDRESGIKGRILRPLSAGVLEPTLPEEQGIVDRSRLLSVTGRSRKVQMQLADAYSIQDYPCPAGGCLLTDRNFACKLRDLFDHQASLDLKDVRMLRMGRHLRIDPDLKVVVGRNEQENESIVTMAKGRHPVIIPEDFSGPACVAMGRIDKRAREVIARILFRYGHGQGTKRVLLQHENRQETWTVSSPISDAELDAYRIS
jgi:tRNA U34 2-thiouridine synthase MnmA/TrmU